MRASLLLLAALLLAPVVARAGDGDLDKFLNAAVRMYENLEYERALQQVKNARPHASTPDEQARVSLYEGIVLADLNRPDEAQAAFKEALLLDPDAKLPLKVAPKVALKFEALRAEVKKELAPLLAKQEAERKRAEAEARAREEAELKRAEAEARARAGQLAQLEAERARLAAEREKLTQAQHQQAQAELAAREAALKAAEQKAQREAEAKRAEEAERRAAAERQAEAERRALLSDRPLETHLVPDDTQPIGIVGTPPPPKRTAPIVPLVFVGAGAAAAGVGAYFGMQAQDATAAARAEPFQDVAHQHLQRAGDQATVANVLYGTAGAMALGALISGLVWMTAPGEPPPLPPEATTP